VWRVPSLQFPGEETAQGSDFAEPASLLEYDSLRLFVERAAQIEPGFRIDTRDIRATAQICRRLDGIPLAIELAAARVGSLSLPGISERLDDRFRLLTGGRRTALPRHQTLAALIDWSFNLLPDAEQTLLQRLSVFVGGWTLEAAARVCGGFGLAQTESEILDLLGALIEKSLVVYEPSDTQPPYRLLETVRQYAWEQLAAAGETERVRGAHLNTMFELVDAADRRFGEAQLDEWLDMLERDHGNLLAALEWALISHTHREAGFRLATSLWGYWEVRGYYAEGREWTEKLAKLAHSFPERQSLLLLVAANLAMWQGDTGQAMSLAQEAMEISRRCDHKFGVAGSLTCLGGVASRREDVAVARTYYEQGLAAWRELGDVHFVAAMLNNLGVLSMIEGRAAAAEKFHLESLAMRREAQNTRGIATSYINLAIVAMHSGDPRRALGYSQDCLTIMKRMSDPGGMAAGIEGIAEATFAISGDDAGIVSDCVRLLGAATALRETAGAPLTPFMQRKRRRLTEHLTMALGGAAYEAAWNDGCQMPREAAFQLASRLYSLDQNQVG
jgi:non-specific serine/threonine protein kinase